MSINQILFERNHKELPLYTPKLVDEIRIVKENERLAAETYANAAKQVNSLGKELFVQLSKFEKFHNEKLTALEKSLKESGKFIH